MKRNAYQLLKELAEKQRDGVARKMANIATKRKDAENKLTLLNNYRSDYLTRLKHSSSTGIEPNKLRNYQTFLQNLDSAIEQQTSEIETCAQQFNHTQTEWLHEQKRVKSFNTLNERRVKQEAKLEHKRQQKQQDEFAQRFVLRKHAT